MFPSSSLSLSLSRTARANAVDTAFGLFADVQSARRRFDMATASGEIEAKSPTVTTSDEEKQPAATWDAEVERKLRLKCDRHVLPSITLLFFMSFLDRTNIGEYSIL